MSHELRNPLGAMRTSVAAIEKLSRKDNPLFKSSADIVDRSITRCDTVIADLLTFVQAPKLTEEPTVVDDLVKETLDEYVLPAPEIVLRDELGCDAVVDVDRERLRRAIERITVTVTELVTLVFPDPFALRNRVKRLLSPYCAETEHSVKVSLGRLGRALEEALSRLPASSVDGASPQAEAQLFLSVYFGLRVLAKGGNPIQALKGAKNTALRSLSPAG